MRITGGRLEGRHLLSPGGRVRPTAEEIRTRWLSELGPHLRGARVLELFAGTGALGLEALSRGAASVDFVEWNPSALHALKGNVTALRVRDAARIFRKDALEFVGAIRTDAYDLVLADPPYTSTLAATLAARWLERPFSTILSVEHPAELPLPPGGSTWIWEGTGVTTWHRPEAALPIEG